MKASELKEMSNKGTIECILDKMKVEARKGYYYLCTIDLVLPETAKRLIELGYYVDQRTDIEYGKNHQHGQCGWEVVKTKIMWNNPTI
jgi:hypothetical protein